MRWRMVMMKKKKKKTTTTRTNPFRGQRRVHALCAQREEEGEEREQKTRTRKRVLLWLASFDHGL